MLTFFLLFAIFNKKEVFMKRKHLTLTLICSLLLTFGLTACKERDENGEIIALKYENFSTLEDFPTHPEDEKFFSPESDDYSFSREKGTSGGYDDNGNDFSFYHDQISMTVYDDEGNQIRELNKLIFDDTDTASQYMELYSNEQPQVVVSDHDEYDEYDEYGEYYEDDDVGEVIEPNIYTQVDNIVYIEVKNLSFSFCKQMYFTADFNNPQAVAERKKAKETGTNHRYLSKPYLTKVQMELQDLEYATP